MTRPRVTVVGLGPAGPDLLTAAARDALAGAAHRYVRTTRHPAAGALPWTASFDALYERAATLEDVYAGIVEELVAAAGAHGGDVVYAVPGSPAVAERTVVLLRDDPRVDVTVVPALSFADLAWVRLGVDPLAAGVRLVDGHRFAVEAAGERGPLLVAQCDAVDVLSSVKLTFGDAAGGARITVLQRLGLPGEAVFEVAVPDLDRSVTPDHLTSLYVPRLAAPVAGEVAAFDELVRTLRERCPWDREQTHRSLTRHLLEETYEVLEAIEALGEDGAGFEHLEEELGDLLFQVVFHTTLAAEAGQFTLADVARGIHDKLVRRHPHVFGDVEAGTADAVRRNWEEIKKAEKGRASVMDGIPGDLPSLLYAHKVLRKAVSTGFDEALLADPSGPGPEGADVGARLLALVDEARRREIDPEAALRAATARLRDRVVRWERRAGPAGPPA